MADRQGGIGIEIVWDRQDGPRSCRLQLPANATAAEALVKAAQVEGWSQAASEGPPLGIFSRRIEADHVLQDGDRLEIYRSLQLDPKDARRRRAMRAR